MVPERNMSLLVCFFSVGAKNEKYMPTDYTRQRTRIGHHTTVLYMLPYILVCMCVGDDMGLDCLEYTRHIMLLLMDALQELRTKSQLNVFE